MIVVFMQQKHDSNWIPFFKKTIDEAETFVSASEKDDDYEASYICEVISFSRNYHVLEKKGE